MDQVLKHSIVCDFMPVRDKFPLLDDVRQERDVVDRGTLWIGKVVVSVKLKDTADVTHEGGMTKAKPFDVLALDEGDHVTGDGVVACLQRARC